MGPASKYDLGDDNFLIFSGQLDDKSGGNAPGQNSAEPQCIARIMMSSGAQLKVQLQTSNVER
ncbi:hypothetical protein E4U43_007441 [Claviceps pusilla]|uniref:Uncharacterized protein n=1 Tax=Claviceps pusilla TaxID=123648 RepID=A0A9P7ND12_9HYPO|nr:hypothetical protein E4U43_007441 [Claviceps pusilla]